MNNNPTFKYYFSFKLASSYKATDGFPLSGHVIAHNITEANIMANDIADKVRKSAWENGRGIAFETIFGKDVHLSQSVSVVEMSVSRVEIVSSWGDCHDERLRDKINLIWSMPMHAERLKSIMSAYWERDKDELADYFCEECYWWSAAEKTFDEICEEGMYEEMCYQMFNHIFDDTDYSAIIDFIRPQKNVVI